jgi:FixJ family two-component response regulator
MAQSFLQSRRRVYVVDDDLGTLRAIERLLSRHGYEAVLFQSAEAFEYRSDFREVVCVLLDINLNGGRSGIELRQRLKQAGHAVPVIYMTGDDNPDVHKAALESGCLAFLLKPVSVRSLIGPLERASGLAQPNV